jgi:hypothetical protein
MRQLNSGPLGGIVNHKMRKLKIIIILVSCTFYPLVTYAGDDLHLEIYIGKAGITSHAAFAEQWQVGSNIVYRATSYIELCGLISYHKLAHDSRLEDIETFFGEGYSVIVTDHGYRYDIGIGIRLLLSESESSTIYCVAQGGYSKAYYPEKYWMYYSNNNIIKSTSITPKYSPQGVISSFGFGVVKPITRTVAFCGELSMSTSWFITDIRIIGGLRIRL